MHTKIALLVAIVLGLAVGVSSALMRAANPGSEYERLMKVTTTPMAVVEAANGPKLSKGLGVIVEGGQKFDFGVMDRGETRSHTFKFRNDTEQPIQLRVGSTTCKCTVGELADDTVPPGGVGDVTLEWVAKSYDPSFQQMATIETTCPLRPDVMLTVKGQVLQLVQPLPQAVFLNDVPYGVDREQQFVIYSFQKGDPLTVLEHSFDDESTEAYFDLQWEPADVAELQDVPDGVQSAVLCKLAVRSDLPYGKVNQSLRITTDAERSAVIEMPIGGRVVSDLMIVGDGFFESADVLKLGMVPPEGKKVVLRLVARRADVHKTEVTSIVCEPGNVLQASVGEPKSLKGGAVLMYPLTIEVRGDAPAVSFMGGKEKPRATIVMETTHPVVQRVKLDVRFFKSS